MMNVLDDEWTPTLVVKELVKLFHLYAFNKDNSYVDVSFLMVPILADHSFELVFFIFKSSNSIHVVLTSSLLNTYKHS